ncbi:BON domain-containing protein [Bacteriovoracaceae bacterium]|nr:BON domain-containing protein [Bacteriovoracaceae bacterium]
MKPVNKNNNTKKKSFDKILNLYTYKKPSIVIIGKNNIRKSLPEFETNANVRVLICKPSELSDYTNHNTIAILIDEDIVSSHEADFLEHTLLNFRLLPVFLLSRTMKSAEYYKYLYDKGLQGVFQWPEQSEDLHDLIIESLKPHPKTFGKTKGDKKLASIVKSNLLLKGRFKNIKVKVIEGFVFLKGVVKSLAEKKYVERETSKIPGVKLPIVKNLEIKSKNKVTDKELERIINLYIGNTLGPKKRTLVAKVKKKIVTFKGAVEGQGEMIDIENFAMRQPGVKQINRNVRYMPSMVIENVHLAKRIEKRIKSMLDGVRHISIKIYGSFAEVSGVAQFNADKKLVEKYVLQMLPVTKVVNKVHILK